MTWCIRCGEPERAVARRLCKDCVTRIKRIAPDTLYDYPTTSWKLVDVVDSYKTLYRRHPSCGSLIGLASYMEISYAALTKAIERARKKGLL